MAKQKLNISLVFSIFAVVYSDVLHQCHGKEYNQHMTQLMEKLLGERSGYNHEVRPPNHPSTNVSIVFSLVSLLEIDDVKQTFSMSGFLIMEWYDERLQWNTTTYGNKTLTPSAERLWTPAMGLVNSIKEWDVFKLKEFQQLIYVYPSGSVRWTPSGGHTASCILDMWKFPFDEQNCRFFFCSDIDIEFHVRSDEFYKDYFITSGEWDILDTSTNIAVFSDATEMVYTCPNFNIKLKRRPGFYIINIIVPVSLLSFINSCIYLIPEEAGEKIGFGVTIMLTMYVFLMTVSSMIPRAPINIPAISIYLLVLMAKSVLTVLLNIASCFLHFAEENETTRLRVRAKYKHAVRKVLQYKKAFRKTAPKENTEPLQTQQCAFPSNTQTDTAGEESNYKPPKNTYTPILKHINKVFFFTSMTTWITIQIVYFVVISI